MSLGKGRYTFPEGAKYEYVDLKSFFYPDSAVEALG
jgi:hypothetical protein